MTLATTCPVCKTSFKVIPDQLKLRRGLVRCGSCQTVFSGIDHLRQVNYELGQPQDQAPEFALAGAAGGEPPAPASEQPAEPANPDSAAFTAAAQPELVADSLPQDFSDNEVADRDEVLSQLLADIQPEPQERDAEVISGATEAPDAEEIPSESLADDQPPEPSLAPAEPEIPAFMPAPQEDAIDFFSESAQRRIRWWPRSAGGKVFAVVLLVGLTLQVTLALRAEVVARFPSARPALAALAQPLGLEVELPRNPRKITIEIDLAIGDAPGMYRMNALLRSHADTALQWPAIEISLTDANGAAVVRRVLMPKDYLADQATIVAGLPGGSEQNLRVDFMLRDVVLTGYSAVLFYP